MGAFKGVDGAEQEYRRQLLIEARKGKAAAKEELEREYHVRTYSAAERAKRQSARLVSAASAHLWSG